MKDLKQHWVWGIPDDEMAPLGDSKYKDLWEFVSSEEFFAKETQIDTWELVRYIEFSRENASRIYIIYKYDIENNTLNIKRRFELHPYDKKIEAEKEAKAKKKKAKKTPKLPDNVINFSDFKNKVG